MMTPPTGKVERNGMTQKTQVRGILSVSFKTIEAVDNPISHIYWQNAQNQQPAFGYV